MIIFRPICWIREVFRNLWYDIPMDGHDFVEIKHTKKKSVIKCALCGLEVTSAPDY